MTEATQLPTKKPYSGQYRNEVWKDDEPAATQEEPTPEVDPQTAPAKNEEEETWKSRYSNLRSHTSKQIDGLKRELEQLKSAQQTAVTPPEKKVANEKVAAFKSKYDDVYEVIETTADEVATGKLTGIQKKLGELEQENLLLRHEKAKEKLYRMHPDFDELNNSEEFHAWVSVQPQELQDWLYKNSLDADKASYVIKLYKQEKKPAKPTKADKQKEIDASTAVKSSATQAPDGSGKKKVWKASEVMAILKKNPNAYDDDAFENELDLARIEGRFVDDLSK